MTNSMLLISSLWKDKATFKMIPTSLDCPYNECIYDPEEKILAIVSKQKKEAFHMLPKLTDTGDVVLVKNGKRIDGKPYAEQRVMMDTYYEYFIREQNEIEDFVTSFASNTASFDFQRYFIEKPTVESASVQEQS